MKTFFQNVCSTVVGIFVAGFIFVAFLFGSIMLLALAVGGDETEIKDNSVLAINLTGIMNDRERGSNPLEKLVGEVATPVSLNTFLQGIEEAKTNDKVKGIYLEAGAFQADSYATLQEARKALVDFEKSGKWVIAYADTYTQQAYYLASAATKVYLNPSGMIDWHGVASQPIFLKDALAKFGVKMQVAKVGKYKSATEMFTEDKMSEPNREQTKAFISGIWNNVVKEVGASRKLTTAQLNQYADSAITFAAPTDYQRMKLVDGLLYTDQIKKVVMAKMGVDDADDLHQVSLDDMVGTIKPDFDSDEVAVYYMAGDIVDGVANNPMAQGEVIDAQKVCKDLAKLAEEESVKAVVLRINSGGGSAYASEQIWHQIMELKKQKPVVVSMGGLAASGAYYSSAPANWIVANPTTLTGSIGIFGMFPDASGLLTEKLGVKFDEVATNKYAAFGSPARPFNADELRILGQYIDCGYALFRHRVAEGRKMTEQQVEQLAQGHVYTGEYAKTIGLVDELGGIDVAIAKAAKLARLTDYAIADYPAPMSWLEQLMQQNVVDNYLDEKLKAQLGDFYQPYTLLKTMNKQSAIQARIPYELNIH